MFPTPRPSLANLYLANHRKSSVCTPCRGYAASPAGSTYSLHQFPARFFTSSKPLSGLLLSVFRICYIVFGEVSILSPPALPLYCHSTVGLSLFGSWGSLSLLVDSCFGGTSTEPGRSPYKGFPDQQMEGRGRNGNTVVFSASCSCEL